MRNFFIFLLIISMSSITIETSAKGKTPENYEKAIELIHAFGGSGDELQRAMELADALSKSHPNSGYAQTLQAESLSTWELDQEGKPAELRDKIIKLADEAIRLNPMLAQAYVAKSRALVRASMYTEAENAINKALKLNPNLSGAIFMRAEIFRRTKQFTQADVWYRKFINSTSSSSRKSNGYYWLGRMYEDASWDTNSPTEQQAFTAKAMEPYEQSIKLDPNSAWGNVNFAVFLNDYPADFERAEHYAQKALSMMEFPMARYHLAAARYQKLWAKASMMNSVPLGQAVNNVYLSTSVSLKDAMSFSSFSSVVRNRLQELQSKIQSSSPSNAPVVH
jgi:tetratricopeptide (TPR) repeat protein